MMSNEKMLRETIRLILESQGQTTSRVDPATTSPGFRPFSLVPGLAIAAGIAGLQQIHDWVGARCTTPDPTLSEFPIKLSKKYSDLLVKSRKTNATAPINSTVWRQYQDSIAEAGDQSKVPPPGNVDDTNSDLANLTALYREIGVADKAWTVSSTVFNQADPIKIIPALNAVYQRFTGCSDAFKADSFPPEIDTRAQYRAFLGDIALLSHNSFITGLSTQRAEMFRVNDSAHNVNGIIQKSLSVEKPLYDKLSASLKSK